MPPKKLLYPRRDLINKVFDRLTVIKFVKYEQKGIHRFDMWECLCSCGESKITKGNSLLTKRVRSCGCLLEENYKKMKNVCISRNIKSKGEAAFNDLYSSYKYRSRKHKSEFNLTKEQFKDIINNNCFWCGIKPYKQIRNKYNGTITFNGIDRLDSNIGYTIENSRSCCEICNKAKRDLSVKDFLNWIKRLTDYQRGLNGQIN